VDAEQERGQRRGEHGAEGEVRHIVAPAEAVVEVQDVGEDVVEEREDDGDVEGVRVGVRPRTAVAEGPPDEGDDDGGDGVAERALGHRLVGEVGEVVVGGGVEHGQHEHDLGGGIGDHDGAQRRRDAGGRGRSAGDGELGVGRPAHDAPLR